MALDKDSTKGNFVFQEWVTFSHVLYLHFHLILYMFLDFLIKNRFEPKEWEETDVDIKVTHCGICGSDVHTARSGWGPTTYPICVGHEIVGIIVRAGSKAERGMLMDYRHHDKVLLRDIISEKI